MALGAFLAGVLLASSEYRHALETDIEPFKGLLLGLFFISVGMADRFRPARARPSDDRDDRRRTAGAEGRDACGSWRECMGVGARQRWLFAALLAQGGEFAFVVFGVAQTAACCPPMRRDELTIAVALSMAATPLMLLLHDKLAAWRAAASERADDDDRGVRQSGDHRGLRALRPDRRPPAVRQRHARHRARSRRRAGRSAAQVRLQGVLRRRDASRPAARGGRGETRACWSMPSTTSPTASRSPTACASTFPTCR